MPTIEIVIKSDTYGSLESVLSSIEQLSQHGQEIKPIRSGEGAINKSDILMAQTGSKLIIGFNVDVLPGLDSLIRQQDIEIRIYKIIYRLIEELKSISRVSTEHTDNERITGEAKVIALFKSSRKGIIIGCKVNKGVLSSGKKFRIISEMGIIYTGRIESLHIGRDTVNVARAGQQAGIKISGFKKVKVGDLVECLEHIRSTGTNIWKHKAGIFRI